MITIIVLTPDGPVVTHHDADLYAGAAYVYAIGVDLEAFIMARGETVTKVARLVRSGDEWSANEANGYHLIRLHDALNVGGEPLYRFTAPSVAIARLVDFLDKRHPAPDRPEMFPTANNALEARMLLFNHG